MPRATDVLYVRYQVTDLAIAERFLADFGMSRAQPGDGSRLYMRGTGDAPFLYEAVLGDACRFLGAGLRVQTRTDLEQLAALPDSGPIEQVDDVPGKGERVRMRMPDGFEIDAVYGGTPAPLPTSHSTLHDGNTLPFNTAHAKPRVNRAVRVAAGPVPVRRLGHFVLHVLDHDVSVEWLQTRFGLMASDFLAPPDQPDRVVGSFLRIDAGEQLVDHHCMLVLGAQKAGVHHCSFEVEDLDAVMAGHDHLTAQGYELDCGVGRHLLGSQIFDYWRDPFGFRIEHYTDGDVVNNAHRATIFSGTADETTQWGAKPPREFFS
ncbi:VOC family protein [Pandoraea anhela]|uniref:Manganese-dependent 2,3-dihydroxybiphenyl 1,2-dioxygenase n=1 Tax=Pandoraea anhela TaxID=2508295 RepID=A0A5E4X458_9BURK|nr:VOC family protein [Pandoraea anhela]VVE31032.1 Manganese-dependent 2,3-dihydroxybiphenyl 1,2-dioxygenase [Pandoraea anhela]